jgi:hypothetical protein
MITTYAESGEENCATRTQIRGNPWYQPMDLMGRYFLPMTTGVK